MREGKEEKKGREGEERDRRSLHYQ